MILQMKTIWEQNKGKWTWLFVLNFSYLDLFLLIHLLLHNFVHYTLISARYAGNRIKSKKVNDNNNGNNERSRIVEDISRYILNCLEDLSNDLKKTMSVLISSSSSASSQTFSYSSSSDSPTIEDIISKDSMSSLKTLIENITQALLDVLPRNSNSALSIYETIVPMIESLSGWASSISNLEIVHTNHISVCFWFKLDLLKSKLLKMLRKHFSDEQNQNQNQKMKCNDDDDADDDGESNGHDDDIDDEVFFQQLSQTFYAQNQQGNYRFFILFLIHIF